MSEFGEEISRIAHEGGDDAAAVDGLIASATSDQLEELAQIWDMAPEQARPAIERLMANLQIRHQQRVRALEQMGVEVPPSPIIPERIQERLQEQESTQEQERVRGQTAIPDAATGTGYQYGPGLTGESQWMACCLNQRPRPVFTISWIGGGGESLWDDGEEKQDRR
jgi:hypothetical protein